MLAGIWQLVAVLSESREAAFGRGESPLIPGWDWIFGEALPALSSYGGGGLGLAEGTSPTYGAAFVVIAEHSAPTWARLLTGLALGACIGIGAALAISWSKWGRRLVALPSHVLRTLPLLAMVPLFQLWFGLSFHGMVLFIAFGVGVIFFTSALNAVEHVPQIFIDNSRALGASRLSVYRTIILPSILPELRSALFLALGLSWTAVAAAELLGAQTGLGFILANAEEFALLDRMTVVALVFVVYAAASFIVLTLVLRRVLAWMPQARGW